MNKLEAGWVAGVRMRLGRGLKVASLVGAVAVAQGVARAQTPGPVVVGSGWQMQAVDKVTGEGKAISMAGFRTAGWYRATVPGTVLTTLVNNKVYPEPLYGENMRPEVIPESLARTSYWFRTEVMVPRTYAGRHVWLNFEGINYSAAVWVNGAEVGTMRGAFRRGNFDVSNNVRRGQKAVVAVLVSPQPHPGVPDEHTLRMGIGQNGGDTAMDGPTFLSTIGWDWLNAVRDRDTGIWQKVTLSATGPVLVRDPLVTTELPLPRTDSADVSVAARLENVTGKATSGVLTGRIEGTVFRRRVDLGPHESRVESFRVGDTPGLRMARPRLWWPNGYGEANLYKLHLSFVADGTGVSDGQEVTFGVRKITYEVADSDNLTISVNGVRVFIRGGNWGLDEALKRLPKARMEAQMRLHKLANLNMIRNWVGQSTSEQFYELSDKYGMLLWDEFFQPNPSDGPNPADLGTYMTNVREKILRFRNHPSIAVWCARNEGFPPVEIDTALRGLMAELEPTRMYQPSSTEGRGVKSDGPYSWRTPREFYASHEPFKTETGSVSVPTIESIRGMMPEKDWETINDDWAAHDFAGGHSGAENYRGQMESRYGKIANLADFVRKAQMMNYEAYRAMYEGRNAQMFHPTTGTLTWMSHPAQPSFVWQLYHYDLEPNASLFAVKSASEMVHVQWNETTDAVEVINNRPDDLRGVVAQVTVYSVDGATVSTQEFAGTAAGSAVTSLGTVELAAGVHFVKLELRDGAGKKQSENFYWRGAKDKPDDLTALESPTTVTLGAEVERHDGQGKTVVTVRLYNAGTGVAVMSHVQLRRKSGGRVLPVYYSENYVSLVPGEMRTITMEASRADLKGEDALVVVDGWNVGVERASGVGVSVELNTGAQVASWPVTGLPIATEGLR